MHWLYQIPLHYAIYHLLMHQLQAFYRTYGQVFAAAARVSGVTCYDNCAAPKIFLYLPVALQLSMLAGQLGACTAPATRNCACQALPHYSHL